MDAVKFIKEAKRMCQSYEKCEGCPAHTGGFDDFCIDTTLDIDAENTVDIVEKWAKEHPRKTMGSEFLKHYPDARVRDNGMVDICPRWVNEKYAPVIECYRTNCSKCKEEYWTQEVE